MKHAEVEKLQIPKVGLKEGVMLDMMPDVKIHSPEGVRKQVVAFATEIGRKYQLMSHMVEQYVLVGGTR